MLLIARCPAGVGAAMIPVAPGVRFWLAFGRVDMWRGMNGLALRVQETLRRRALSRVLILAVPTKLFEPYSLRLSAALSNPRPDWFRVSR